MKLTIKLHFYAWPTRPVLVVHNSKERHGMLSINVPEANIADNEFIAKLYSENENWAGLLLEQHPEWFVYTGRTIKTSFVECPVYQLTSTFISNAFESTYNSRTDIYDADPQLFDLHKKYCES